MTLKSKDRKRSFTPGEVFFFFFFSLPADQDQFERLRLLVIRYKMVVVGLVCQKSIAKAIHFVLPSGSYGEDWTAHFLAPTMRTHARARVKTTTPPPGSRFSGTRRPGRRSIII